MDIEVAETSIYLYETLAPLGETFQYESSFSPPSGCTLTDGGLHTSSQTMMGLSTSILATTEVHSSNISSPVLNTENRVTDQLQGRVRASGMPQAASSDQKLEVDAETNLSERVIGRLEVGASGAPLVSISKDEEYDFLSLDVDELVGTSLEVQAVLAEEGEMLISDIRNSPAQEPPPWAGMGRLHGTSFRSPFLQLHQEIVDFCNFVAPTQEEQQVRVAAVQRVSEVVKSIWPSCQVKVFGSFATGLFLPTSDCDVVILDSGCQVPQDGLKALSKALNRKSLVKNLQVIGKARVPIVKFIETESNISFDISFDVANGPDAADFIRDAMTVLPPLKPLCLVLKIFLQQRELNEVYTGGIGSYALIVMLLTHLQMHPSRRNTNSHGESCPLETNLGILLVDFFDFYGRALNVRDVGISCRSGGRFYSKTSRGFLDSGRPYLLSVEDPQSPDNDIGRNSYNVTKVRSAFLLAHRLLTKLEVEDVPAHFGLLGRIVRMDKQLVKRKSLLPELHRKVSSKIKLVSKGPSTGNSSSSAFFSEFEAYVPGLSSQDRWNSYADNDFPRGGELERKLTRKRKHAKERADIIQGEETSLSSHHQHKSKKEELVIQRCELSFGSGKRLRHGRDPASTTLTDSHLSTHHFYEDGSIEKWANNGRISKHEKLRRRETSTREDEVIVQRILDGKKNRWQKQGSLKKDFHEDVDVALVKDDYSIFNFSKGEEEDEGVLLGTGNGHNRLKRWTNEVRSQKPPRARLEGRVWIPDGEHEGRPNRRVVITKPSHKKIRYS